MKQKPPKGETPEVVMPHVPVEKLLSGQKALVTGANSGIGRGIALALGNAGADVAVNYITDPEAADEVVKEIEKNGSQAFAIKADVSREDQVKKMFAILLDRFGTLDILINNAGIQRDAPVDELTLQQWQQVIDVNLTGPFLCAREAIREFKRKGVVADISCAAGKIICISSVHEVIPWAGHVNYAASKGGVNMMMQSIAQEVAPYRIRVNNISPGAIRTPINRDAWNTPEALASLKTLIPYNRIGDVDDIGRATVWLASDQADYITGTSLYIDGGMTLYPGFATGG
jgi:glucose 1-dehydrogenase